MTAVESYAADSPCQKINGSPFDYGKYRPTAYSTYKQEFSPKFQRKRSPFIKRSELQLSEGGMETVSKYAEDFRPHNGYRRNAAIRPVDEIARMEGVMESNTTSRDAFCAKPLTRRVLRAKEEYRQPDVKMDCSTSYGSDFYARTEYCKLPPIRPQERKDSAKPFVATTENREQFKMYQRQDLTKLASYKPRMEYVRPSEPFGGISSYKGEFTPRSSERPHQFRPQGNITMDGEYFGGPPSPPPPLSVLLKHQTPLSPIGTVPQNEEEEKEEQEADIERFW